MQRFISGLAFTLGFAGVMALATGMSSSVASGSRASDAYGAQLAPGGARPFVLTQTTAAGARSALYFINAQAYPDTLPANPSHTSFGRLMPDGTYCGVGCRTTDTSH